MPYRIIMTAKGPLQIDDQDTVSQQQSPWPNAFASYIRLMTPEDRQQQRAPLGLKPQPGDIALPPMPQVPTVPIATARKRKRKVK